MHYTIPKEKPPTMYPEGRTMRAATDAGNFFRVEGSVVPEGADYAMSFLLGEFCGSGTIEETLFYAAKHSPSYRGEATIYRHLPNSRCGCAVLEQVGTATFGGN